MDTCRLDRVVVLTVSVANWRSDLPEEHAVTRLNEQMVALFARDLRRQHAAEPSAPLEKLAEAQGLDFTPLLAALKKIGYSRWTEIFMHPVPRGIPILETTAAVTAEINKSRKYLEAILNHG